MRNARGVRWAVGLAAVSLVAACGQGADTDQSVRSTPKTPTLTEVAPDSSTGPNASPRPDAQESDSPGSTEPSAGFPSSTGASSPGTPTTGGPRASDPTTRPGATTRPTTKAPSPKAPSPKAPSKPTTPPPPPPPPPPASTVKEETGLRSGVYSQHASTRSSHSLGALSTNSCLAGYAKSHARNLATTDSGLRHQSMQPILGACSLSRVGENVASGYTSAAAAQTGWMNSPGHRANILNGEFNRIGASVYRADSGTLYWVVVFGRAR